MTNIFAEPQKIGLKKRLFEIALTALQDAGWKVERVERGGKSSVRRITKGTTSKLVSIRTSQDTWIAFPRSRGDKGWRTLDEVDAVAPVSVDNRDNPRFAMVHLIDADEMRDRFNRAYAARKKAGHTIQIGRGVWVSLYAPEAQLPVRYVGAGVGLKFPAIARVPLEMSTAGKESAAGSNQPHLEEGGPLTIAEAKRRLAIALGVDPANIKITVEA